MAAQQRGIPQLAMGSNAVSKLCQFKVMNQVGWRPTFALIRSLPPEMQQSKMQCHTAAGQLTLYDCVGCYCLPARTGRTGVPKAATVARLKQDDGGSLFLRSSLWLRHPLNTHHVSAFSQATSKQPALRQDPHCISEISHRAIKFLSSSTGKYCLGAVCCTYTCSVQTEVGCLNLPVCK